MFSKQSGTAPGEQFQLGSARGNIISWTFEPLDTMTSQRFRRWLLIHQRVTMRSLRMMQPTSPRTRKVNPVRNHRRKVILSRERWKFVGIFLSIWRWDWRWRGRRQVMKRVLASNPHRRVGQKIINRRHPNQKGITWICYSIWMTSVLWNLT